MNSKYYSAKMNRALREREKVAWMEAWRLGSREVWKLGSLEAWRLRYL
jgi:hypothetical protein